MSAMSASDAREHFAEVVNRTAYGKERVVLTNRGKPLAVLVPIEDLELLEQIEDKQDLLEALTAEAEAQKRGEKPIPWDKAREKLRG